MAGVSPRHGPIATEVDIRESYDNAARAYAEHLLNELDGKPLDRHLLNRFAEAVRDRGWIADLGCGPGHIAKYLHDQGASVVGIDLSPEMVRTAKELAPEVEFRTGDMRALDCADGELAGIVAFYSIVHFVGAELEAVFRECRRILRDRGVMLVAFHIGDDVNHLDELFGQRVSLDFRFHQPAQVAAALRNAGFVVSESVEREPYENVEYPSRRCYLFCTTTT